MSNRLPPEKWVDLQVFAPDLKFDIRYARTDNFLGEKVYDTARAFLLEPVAKDLVAVHQALKEYGFGLLIFDGYRPWSVTKLFWDRSSPEVRKYLANPETGSAHNRGCAVDLSMYFLSSGEAVAMPSDFDEMNEKAHAAYEGGTVESRFARDLLRKTMIANRFRGITNEWWHFNHELNGRYPVRDYTFAQMDKVIQTY